ncbi:hypothetical protein J6T21_04380 [Candidatus Saccharibacteria bacterium]|nr:hypothetical protein [Candidatus Saccharibacteria bacterium]
MKKIRTKQGIASFYLVAMATLLLGVLTVGFSTYVVNEVNRTTNFDLSKSAYDSALAGIQDAKLAIMNYNSCIKQGAVESETEPTGPSATTCDEIIYYMHHPDCYMVGRILGRYPAGTTPGEVMIKESEVSNNRMQQAYTCVKITSPTDYRTRLNSSDPTRVIPLKIKGGNIDSVKTLRISWADNTGTNYNNTLFEGSSLVFGTNLSNPPLISLQLMQTSNVFNLSDFDYSHGAATNRGTLYLAPSTGKTNNPSGTITNRYIDVTADNRIPNAAGKGFAKSNDKVSQNLPYLVNCSENTDASFLCSAEIELPNAVGGQRSEETFILVVSLPYGGPDTDIAISLCTTEHVCNSISNDENVTTGDTTTGTGIATIKNQLRIDSTGRANNLFKRIESRVETSENGSYSFSYDAIQALGSNNSKTIVKKVETDVENSLTTAPARNPNLKTFTLTYSARDSICTSPSNVPATQTAYGLNYGKFVIVNEEPTCGNNISFAGWTTDRITQSTKYNKGAVVQAEANHPNVTLYAIWKPRVYIIKYHNYQLGNYFEYGSQSVPYGSTTSKYYTRTQLDLKDLILPPKINAGYEIVGWTETQGSSTVQYPVNSVITGINRNMNLYAVWAKTITYNFFQLNNANSSQTATYYNDQVTASINVPGIVLNNLSIDGNNIRAKGWSTSKTNFNSSGLSPSASGTVSYNSQTDYYAAGYYTVTISYKINNMGYDPTSMNEKYADVNIISKGNSGGYKEEVTSFTLPNPGKMTVGAYKTGYQLKQWHIGSASGTAALPGRKYTSNKNITVYAELEPAKFKVSFFSHDGTIKFGEQEFTYGTETNIRNAGASSGWNIIPTSRKPDDTKDFYGWSFNTPNKTDPDFCGNGKKCSFQYEITNDANKMYAIWKKEFTIYFHSNKAKADEIKQTLYNSTKYVEITAINLQGITGLTPITWSNSSSGISNNWNAGTKRNVSSNENWYAAYEYQVKISYNKNSTTATGTMTDSYGTAKRIYSSDTSSHALAASIKLQSCGFTNTGYNFNYWRIGSTSGDAKAPGNNHSTTTNITVYADWNARVYDVTLSKNGGSGGTDKIYETYGVNYSLDSKNTQPMSSGENPIAKPSKSYTVTLKYVNTANDTSSSVNAVFAGYKNSSGTTAIDASGYITAVTNLVPANQTFTAQWNAGKYIVPTNEVKTDHSCEWHKGSTSGTVVANTIDISGDTTLYSVCTLQLHYVTLMVNNTEKATITNSSSGGTSILDGSGKKIIAVKAGGTEVAINGNELYFGDAPTVKYYLHSSDPTNYEFDKWSIENGTKVNKDMTITGSVKEIPWKCNLGETLIFNDPKGAAICVKSNPNYSSSTECVNWYGGVSSSCSSAGNPTWKGGWNTGGLFGTSTSVSDGNYGYYSCSGSASDPYNEIYEKGILIFCQYDYTCSSCTYHQCAITNTKTYYSSCPSGWSEYNSDRTKCYRPASKN